MQISQPLSKIRFQSISQKPFKLESEKDITDRPMVFMVEKCNKIYVIKVKDNKLA